MLPYSLQELVCPGAEPRWSLAELIHAVILMAQAHSLCSFVWGCGLNPEPDHSGGYTFQPPSPIHLPRSPHSPAVEDGRQEVSCWNYWNGCDSILCFHLSYQFSNSFGHGTLHIVDFSVENEFQ